MILFQQPIIYFAYPKPHIVISSIGFPLEPDEPFPSQISVDITIVGGLTLGQPQ